MTDDPVVRLTIDSIAHGGDAVARHPDGRVVFVDRGIPGDEVSARVVEDRARFLRAEVDSVERESASAIPRKCDVSDRCGGCRFWRATYRDEQTWKVEAAVGAARRIARGVEWPEPDVIGATRSERYRGRARFRVGDGGVTGFRAAGSHALVPSETCLVVDEVIDDARRAVRPILAQLDQAHADGVMIERDARDGRAVVTLDVAHRDFDRVVSTLRAALDETETAVDRAAVGGLVVRAGTTRLSLVGDGQAGRSEPAVPEQVVARPSGGFAQAHEAMNVRLRELVVAACDAGPRDRVAELFCGDGNFSFPLLAEGAAVAGFDAARDAIGAARQAAQRAGYAIERAWFGIRNLREGLRGRDLARLQTANIILADPPRAGIDGALLRQVAACEARRFVYVSCDPATLARDVGRLARSGWTPRAWQLIDLFPRTAHVESVVICERGTG